MVQKHELIVIKLQMIRLWLLFIPKSLAMSFPGISAAPGTTWNFSLPGILLGGTSTNSTLVLVSRFILVGVTALLATWIRQRRVLRHADATSALPVKVKNGHVA